jgi:hypothetical protein
MTNRSLGRAVFRIWGLIWLISGCLALPVAVAQLVTRPMADPGMTRYMRFGSVMSIAIYLAGGAVMFLAAARLSALAFRVEEPLNLGVDAVALQAVAISILGLYFVVHAVPGVVSAIQALIQKPAWNQDSSSGYLWQRQRDNLLGAVVQLVVGVAIFLGGGALSRAWHRLHSLHAIVETPDEPEGERP